MMNSCIFLKLLKSINIILIIIGLSLLSSCIITRTSGFYSGYKRLTPEQKNKIEIINDKDNLPILKDSITYAITAKHLMGLIKNQSPCIIYFWDPCCSGSACIPIFKFQDFCKNNKYASIIVSEYFDYEQLDIQGVKPSEVFAINHWHYGTDYCNSYMKKFQKSLFELLGTSFNAKYPHKFLYYDGQTLSNNKPKTLSKYPSQ